MRCQVDGRRFGSGAGFRVLCPLLCALFLAWGCQKQPDQASGAAAATAARPSAPVFKEPEVLAQFHFSGAEALKRDTNLTAIAAISSLRESEDLKRELFARSSRAALRDWAGTNHDASLDQLLPPLLDSLWTNETAFELRERADGAREWSLAVRSPDGTAALWETNFWKLTQALSSNAPGEFKLGQLSGWESASFGGESNKVRLARMGEWTLLFGGAAPGTNYGLYALLSKSGRPVPELKQNWLEGKINLSKAGPMQDFARGWKLGEVRFTVASRKDALRTEAEIDLAGDNGWKLEAWNIPTNSIRDPLIGFTVLQGFAGWLREQSWFKQTHWDTAPNQLFTWVQPNIVFATFAAIPTPNATNAVNQLAEFGIPAFTNLLAGHMAGKIQAITNIPGLFWRDLPIIVPFIRPAPEPGGTFLEAGLFPLAESATPAPAELLEQVTSRTNLIYYDWEVTAARLEQFPAINQVISMATDQNLPLTNSVAENWLGAIRSRLGNSITEVVQSSPKQWKLTRRSNLGFTSVELGFFLRWFNASVFPRLGPEFWIDPAQVPIIRTNKPMHVMPKGVPGLPTRGPAQPE